MFHSMWHVTCPSGHELRNPLHGVCAGIEALRGGQLGAAETAQELASIAEGLALMVSVTNDMTDLQVFVRASHRAMYSLVRVRAFS